MQKMKLHVLDNGRLENDRSNQILFHNLATIDNKLPKATWAKIPVYTVLIEHQDGLVLFDAAFNPSAMSERWPDINKQRTPCFASEENYLPKSLKNLGFSTSDINYVVVSHLHEDHAGCLEMFNNAKIIVHNNELTQAVRLLAINKDFGAFIKADIESWIRANLDWDLVYPEDDEIELLNGITILNFGAGHSYGMLGLLVELKDEGNIIIASDAVFTKTNYGPPIVYPGFSFDTIGYANTINKIRRVEKKYRAQVWFGHDNDQFNSLKKSPAGYYE
jgi:glyoxylase-like metal-dependent hydrolase (beta-lactamase superfamily II)